MRAQNQIYSLKPKRTQLNSNIYRTQYQNSKETTYKNQKQSSQVLTRNPEKMIKKIREDNNHKFYLGQLQRPSSRVGQQINMGKKHSGIFSSKLSKSSLLRVNTQQSSLIEHDLTQNYEISLNYKRRLDQKRSGFAKNKLNSYKSNQVLNNLIQTRRKQQNQSLINQKQQQKEMHQPRCQQKQSEMIRLLTRRISRILSETDQLSLSFKTDDLHLQNHSEIRDREVKELQQSLNLLENRVLSWCKSVTEVKNEMNHQINSKSVITKSRLQQLEDVEELVKHLN